MRRRIDRLDDIDFCDIDFCGMMVMANKMYILLVNQLRNEFPHLTGEELRKYGLPSPPMKETISARQSLSPAFLVGWVNPAISVYAFKADLVAAWWTSCPADHSPV